PLLDDTSERPGSKFATMDLIGLPVQMIIGPKNAKQNEVEIKDRKTGLREVLTVEAALNRFAVI
ncbi:MAG: His/Gly/Thr/Pro-type tRNA ligase C-terminal domain-containing protein, partial [Bartonella sp.]|nr:His/Gly/Thr/Pro-type tRNA ligase C-terminal domain-containing protein [Bartonella sp.]